VVTLDALPKDNRANAKGNRIAHMFFLPRFKEHLVDSVVLLNQMTTVHRDIAEHFRRILTLAPEGRFGLYAQFIRWISRWELKEVECPNCSATFNLARTFPVRSPTDA
jgi:hypothetical protein